MYEMLGIPALLYIILLLNINLVVSTLVFIACLAAMVSISGMSKEVKHSKTPGIHYTPIRIAIEVAVASCV
jgi:hypothetical protein